MAPYSAISRPVSHYGLITDKSKVGAGLILVDPPMINGEKYEFQAVRDSQLVKNVSEVMLDSLLTDA